MNAQQTETPPISVERHYEIFKHVEDRIKEYLGDLEHEYFLVGLRVAYDRDQSSSEPGVMPFSIEFGYLGPADVIAECKTDETGDPETVEDELRKLSQRAAIPFDRLKEFYTFTKEELESATDEIIRIGIYIVVTGSPTQASVAVCDCPNRKLRYCCYSSYTKTSKCGRCTSTGC